MEERQHNLFGEPEPTDKKKRTRLSEEWEPDHDDVGYVLEKRPELMPHLVWLRDEFVDYFTGEDCKKPLKYNWKRAWQKWVRNSWLPRYANQPTGEKKQSRDNRGGGVVY